MSTGTMRPLRKIQKAIELDPNYQDAHYALASNYELRACAKIYIGNAQALQVDGETRKPRRFSTDLPKADAERFRSDLKSAEGTCTEGIRRPR